MRIIPRREWGARYANGFGPAPLPFRELWLHHSVTAARNGAAVIRELEQIGQNRFGGGISYTWLITPDGAVYEGHSVDRQGAHTGGRNSISRAICLVGNYESTRPTSVQINSAAWLVRYVYDRRWAVNLGLTGGHRDVKATACPGKYAYAQIGNINTLARNWNKETFLMALTDAEQRELLAKTRKVYSVLDEPAEWQTQNWNLGRGLSEIRRLDIGYGEPKTLHAKVNELEAKVDRLLSIVEGLQ